MRLTKDQYFMEIAESAAKRSTCNRAKVGCCLVKDWVIIWTWYNWAARWEEDCLQKWCLLNKEWNCIKTVHAEVNTLINCSRVWVSSIWTILYCTHLPCSSCSRVIINSWIKKVFYKNDYKWDWSINLWDFIEIEKIS